MPKVVTVIRGMGITRYHTKRTIQSQRVGEHCGRMAGVLACVWPDASAALYKAVALHDVSELATGDIPSPVKWANPALKKALNEVTTNFELDNDLRVTLTDAEALQLRWLDLYEGCLFCLEEYALGNSGIYSTLCRYFKALQDTWVGPPAESDELEKSISDSILKIERKL